MNEKDNHKLDRFLIDLCDAQDSMTHHNEIGPGGWRRAQVARQKRNEIKSNIINFVDSLVKSND